MARRSLLSYAGNRGSSINTARGVGRDEPVVATAQRLPHRGDRPQLRRSGPVRHGSARTGRMFPSDVGLVAHNQG